jgi:UDP-GlcNAc:undecaprenyl-phosphate/decaprenyl-phosphate GlcNAc-1-phosphate transferase
MSARAVRSAAVAGAAARLGYAVLRARPPGGAPMWDRTNHRGEPITLLEGPAVALGGIAGALASGASARDRIALAIAGAGAAAFGGYDDLRGNGASRGFAGHLGALRAGELTTGAVKIAGIGATGLAAALIAGRQVAAGSADRGTSGALIAGPQAGAGSADGGTSAALTLADALINAGLIAGGANLLNLFDLRPGRAIKAATLAGALLAASPGGRTASAAPVSAAVALLPEDLAERSMLGDAGANALGAMLGFAAAKLPRPARVGALAVVIGLTAASEKVSFTKVIERTGPLRWLDMLGRRPVAPAAASESAAPESAAPESITRAAEPSAVGRGVDQADGTPAPRGRRSAQAR